MIVRNLQLVRDRITTACMAAGRQPDAVRLLAVSKNFGADAVLQAVTDGQRSFGEHYIAEGVEKAEELELLKAEGCDYFQGYLRAPPLAPDEFKKFALTAD